MPASWTVVQRTIDGVVKLYVEKLADWFKSEVANDGRFLDSFLVYKGDPESQITGAIHINNTVCDVLADGTVHPPVKVDVEGKVILNKEYSHVVVGLPYESEVRPHLSDADTRDGTSRGRTQRITNITIDLYRSLGMYIGRYDIEDGDKEEEV